MFVPLLVSSIAAQLVAECTTLSQSLAALKAVPLPSLCCNSSLITCNATSILQLNLKNYKLTGQIPAALFTLPGLSFIDLSYNKLTGSIPSVSALKDLDALNLEHNSLVGSLPTDFPLEISGLYLSNNLLSGTIPPSIGLNIFLKVLDLSYNKFLGTLPEGLGQLVGLEKLYLDDNAFTGEVPSGMSALVKLSVLNMGDNQFTGSYPYSSASAGLATCQMTNSGFCSQTLPNTCVTGDMSPCSKASTLPSSWLAVIIVAVVIFVLAVVSYIARLWYNVSYSRETNKKTHRAQFAKTKNIDEQRDEDLELQTNVERRGVQTKQSADMMTTWLSETTARSMSRSARIAGEIPSLRRSAAGEDAASSSDDDNIQNAARETGTLTEGVVVMHRVASEVSIQISITPSEGK